MADTIPTPPSARWTRFERNFRSSTAVAVAVVVAAAALGWLGVSVRSTDTKTDTLAVTVTYPTRARPGLAAPFSIDVRSRNGHDLPPEVTVEITSTYLALFDHHGLEPTPVATWNGNTLTRWTFEVPDGENHLEIDLDARMEPTLTWGRSATVTVRAGSEANQTEINTVVLP